MVSRVLDADIQGGFAAGPESFGEIGLGEAACAAEIGQVGDEGLDDGGERSVAFGGPDAGKRIAGGRDGDGEVFGSGFHDVAPNETGMGLAPMPVVLTTVSIVRQSE